MQLDGGLLKPGKGLSQFEGRLNGTKAQSHKGFNSNVILPLRCCAIAAYLYR